MVKILRDYMLAGTPFRGLIIHSGMCMCAYIGVPLDHALSEMDCLDFECHCGVNFRGEGDGDIRPQGWYWYGWDYGHGGDHVDHPQDFLDLLQQAGFKLPQGKKWTLEEVEQDLINAAMSLKDVLDEARQIAEQAAEAAKAASHKPL